MDKPKYSAQPVGVSLASDFVSTTLSLLSVIFLYFFVGMGILGFLIFIAFGVFDHNHIDIDYYTYADEVEEIWDTIYLSNPDWDDCLDKNTYIDSYRITKVCYLNDPTELEEEMPVMLPLLSPEYRVLQTSSGNWVIDLMDDLYNRPD